MCVCTRACVQRAARLLARHSCAWDAVICLVLIRHAPPDPPGAQDCDGLVDYNDTSDCIESDESSAGSCNSAAGQRYYGGGYGAGDAVEQVAPYGLLTTTAPACASKCAKTDACITFTWNAGTLVCSMHAVPFVGGQTADAAYTSGTCRAPPADIFAVR